MAMYFYNEHNLLNNKQLSGLPFSLAVHGV